MSIPLFPDLTPKMIDSLWFTLDRPRNDESELLQLETQHQNWLNSIQNMDGELLPIGKTATESQDDEEDEEEEEDNDDDESDTHDEEDEDVDMESYDVSDSPAEPSVRVSTGHR
uniref:Anaphase-promoting complex subunit 15 n=1 Tax=Clastoptera arizonana TaxID=38151 RepID=A0A1B6D2N6_9HEMI